jgi:hypothetical protein
MLILPFLEWVDDCRILYKQMIIFAMAIRALPAAKSDRLYWQGNKKAEVG